MSARPAPDAHKRPRLRMTDDELVVDPLLDIVAAAAYLGVGPRMVRRLVAERRVPFVRIGRHIRLRRSDLDDLAAGGRVEAVTR